MLLLPSFSPLLVFATRKSRSLFVPRQGMGKLDLQRSVLALLDGRADFGRIRCEI